MRRFFGWLRRPGIVLSDNRGGPWGPGGGEGGGDGGGNDGGGGGPRNPWGPRRRKPEPRGGGGSGGKGGGDVTSLDEFLRRSRARFGGGLPGGRPYVIYGVRWNDLPPFRLLSGEGQQCKTLITRAPACRIDQTV